MKKLFLLAVVISVFTAAQSQSYIGVSGGLSTPGNKAMFDLNIGYKFSKACIYTEFDMRVVVTNYTGKEGETPQNPAHFGIRTGFILTPVSKLSIAPNCGMYYRLVSNDNTTVNGWDLLYGSKLKYQIAESYIGNVSMISEFSIIGEYKQYLIGLIFSL